MNNKKEYILNLSCKDKVGIVSAVSGFLAKHNAFIIESAQLGDIYTGNFFMRTFFNIDDIGDDFINIFEKDVAKKFNMKYQFFDISKKPNILLLSSKQDHCLSSLLSKVANNNINANVKAVISNHNNVEKLVNWHNIPFYHMPVSNDNRKKQEDEILQKVKEYEIDLIVLARYMQILSPEFIDKLYGKIINIHHSFLPSFKGAKPYHQAFDKGVKIIGATAHYASNDLDEGPIIEQEVIRVDHTHTPEQLLSLGKDIESIVLSRAVQYHIEHRILLNGNKTIVFN